MSYIFRAVTSHFRFDSDVTKGMKDVVWIQTGHQAPVPIRLVS